MKHQVCCLKDTALDAFQRPFYAQTIQHARRMFRDLLQQDSEASRHPEDFILYHLGTFDDHTGKHENNEVPELILRGKDGKQAPAP